MTNEVVFTKLSCGCQWSPVAGLHRGDNPCPHNEDEHQEFIKKAVKEDKK